jgi:hypothetical protein
MANHGKENSNKQMNETRKSIQDLGWNSAPSIRNSERKLRFWKYKGNVKNENINKSMETIIHRLSKMEERTYGIEEKFNEIWHSDSNQKNFVRYPDKIFKNCGSWTRNQLQEIMRRKKIWDIN